jgi:hypothetical protein
MRMYVLNNFIIDKKCGSGNLRMIADSAYFSEVNVDACEK